MSDHILDNLDELIQRKNIIRDPQFVKAWKETYTEIMMGKDPQELLNECKKQYKTDPEFNTYRLLAAAKHLEEMSRGSGRGGARPGAGRKKGQKIKEDFELKKARSIRMTDEEYPLVLDYLKQIRAAKKEIAKDTENYLKEQLPAGWTEADKKELKKTIEGAFAKFAKDNNLKIEGLRIDGDPFIRLMSHEQKESEE